LDSAIASEAVDRLNPEGIISDSAVANSRKERHFRRAKRTRSLARVVDKRVSPNLMTGSKQVFVTVIEIIQNPRPQLLLFIGCQGLKGNLSIAQSISSLV
jgi:hypothetical protein